MNNDLDTLRGLQKQVNLILMLDHGGRAGSNFFQCLFDSHQQLITAPLVHYVYSYWLRMFGDKAEISAAEAREFIAEKSYSRLLYQEPEGSHGDLIEKIGGSRQAPFDRARFRALIDLALGSSQTFSRRETITLIYAAYAMTRGFDPQAARFIMINDAVSTNDEDMLKGFSVRLIDLALEDFPQGHILALMRDPRAQYASTKHQLVNELGNNYNLHRATWKQSFRDLWRSHISLDTGPAHLCFIYQVAAFRDLLRKWREGKGNWIFLRNEDFNTNFVPTMQEFCREIGIDPDPEWIALGDDYKARMMGMPWAGTGAYSTRYQKVTDGPLANDAAQAVAVGPSKYVTERWRSRLPAHEQALLERYFRHEISLLGYSNFQDEKRRKGFGYLLSSLRPWSGEWAGLSWLKKSKNLQDLGARLAYLVAVLPYYGLARIKLVQIDRRGFFDRGFIALGSAPRCVGAQQPGTVLKTSPPKHFSADIASWTLVANAALEWSKGESVRISLARMDVAPRLQKILGFFANVVACPCDLGDFRNSSNLHLFTDHQTLLLEIYNRQIAAKADMPDLHHDGGNFDTFVSRYVNDQWAQCLSGQLISTYYALDQQNGVDRLFLSRTPVSSHFRALTQSRVSLTVSPTSGTLLLDFMNLARYLKALPFFLNGRERPLAPPALTTLAVQHVSGAEKGDYPGDFDWLEESGISPRDTLYLVEGDDTLSPQSEKFCFDRGIRIAATKSWKPHASQDYVRDLKTSLAIVFRYLQTGHFKLAAMAAYHGYFTAWYREFFREHGVIAYMNVADTNLNALPALHALESLGGLDLAFEFSATGYHAFIDARPAGRQSYIFWGSLTHETLLDCEARLPYRIAPQRVFYAGNMRLYMASCMTLARTADLNAIAASGKNNKILVLDSATSHLKLLPVRQRQVFHDAILSLAESRPDDLIILKPQRAIEFTPEQQTRAAHLEEQGRFMVLPWYGLPHYLFAHVDLAIATPIYSSAFMEACAAKCPSICFDQSGWPHVMRHHIPSFMLAENVDQLARQTEKLLSGSLSPSERTDMQTLWTAIDPYGDAQGHRRFAELTGLWMKYLKQTGSADSALPLVEADYDARHPIPSFLPDLRKVGS